MSTRTLMDDLVEALAQLGRENGPGEVAGVLRDAARAGQARGLPDDFTRRLFEMTDQLQAIA